MTAIFPAKSCTVRSYDNSDAGDEAPVPSPAMSATSRSKLVVGSSAVTFLSFAMPVSMLGVMWPDVREHFGQSLGMLGVVSLVYGLSRMSTSGAGRIATRRFGIGACFLAALVGLIVADLVVASATSWIMFLLAVSGIGVVSGLLDSVGAGVVATLGDVGDAGVIHGFYGVGAAVFALVALGVAAKARAEWPPPPADTERDDAGRPPTRATIVSLAVFGAFVALEVTIGNWLFTYLDEGRSISEGIAALAVSGFWGGTMTGRLLLGSPRIREAIDRVGLIPCALLSATGLALATIAPSGVVIAAAALAGLALAPLIPTLSARTARRVGVAHAQRVAGWQLLAANVGAIGVPSLTGLVVDRTGPGAVIVIALLVYVAGVPALLAARRLG
jgi:fucose permease